MTTLGPPRRLVKPPVKLSAKPSVKALLALPALLLLVPVILLVPLVATASPAAAHAVLESTTPAQGSQLGAAPATVTIVLSEEVGLNDRSVQVLDDRGKRVDQADPKHGDGDPRSVRVSVQPGLGNGSYTVMWRVVSADGHPASGTFSFGVGVPAGAVPATTAVDPLVWVIRAISQLAAYAGTALVIGTSLFLFVLWPAGQSAPRMRRLLVVSCAVAGLGAVGTFLVQGPYVSGSTVAGMFDPSLLVETASSSYGRPLLLRLLATALAVPVLGIWPAVADDEDAGPGGVAAVGNGLLLTASFALTGHATEATPRLLAEVADGVHLMAAGAWLGGLVVLFAVFLPRASEREQKAVLPRWSLIAMGCVGALAVTGTYQAWREVRAVNALPATTYGQLVLGKLALVAVLLALGALARRRLAPSGRLRTLVVTEAAVGLAVLGLTTFLVATPPSRVTFGPPFTTSVTGLDVEGRPIRVAISVAPTRTGSQTVLIQATSTDGKPLPFVAAGGQLLALGESEAIDLTFQPGKDGEGSARVVVPSAGRWTLTVHIVTDATTDYAAAATYTVR